MAARGYLSWFRCYRFIHYLHLLSFRIPFPLMSRRGDSVMVQTRGKSCICSERRFCTLHLHRELYVYVMRAQYTHRYRWKRFRHWFPHWPDRMSNQNQDWFPSDSGARCSDGVAEHRDGLHLFLFTFCYFIHRKRKWGSSSTMKKLNTIKIKIVNNY